MSNAHLKLVGSWGPVYWNAPFYRAAMRLVRSSGEREAMLQRVAQEIGSLSVLELCCGVGDLTRWIPGSRYQGIDKNPAFIRASRSRGVRVMEGDILSLQWPSADCLVMTDSLYHFYHELDLLMAKVKLGSFKKIIISEPVKNVTPRLPIGLRWLGLWAARVDGRSYAVRFTEQTLQEVFARYGFEKVFRSGVNVIGVWEKHG